MRKTNKNMKKSAKTRIQKKKQMKNHSLFVLKIRIQLVAQFNDFAVHCTGDNIIFGD